MDWIVSLDSGIRSGTSSIAKSTACACKLKYPIDAATFYCDSEVCRRSGDDPCHIFAGLQPFSARVGSKIPGVIPAGTQWVKLATEMADASKTPAFLDGGPESSRETVVAFREDVQHGNHRG